MKRTGPPKRHTPLKARAETARAFLDRGRGSLARSSSKKRSKPLRSKPKSRGEIGPLSPRECCRVVFELDGGRCIVTGRRVTTPDDLRCYHHPTPKQYLPAGKRWDPRNVVLVLPRVHERHETGTARIPREKLPARVFEFADEVGGTPRAAFERAHPASGNDASDSPGGTDGEGRRSEEDPQRGDERW